MTRNFPFTPLYPSTTYLAPTGNSRGSPDSKRLFDKAMMSLREAIREQNVSSEAHVPWNMGLHRECCGGGWTSWASEPPRSYPPAVVGTEISVAVKKSASFGGTL